MFENTIATLAASLRSGAKAHRWAVVSLSLAFVAWGPSAPAHAQSLDEVFAQHVAGSTETVDHASWTALLNKYVVPGRDGLHRVAYAKFKAESHQQLKSYIASLTKVNVLKLDKPEQFAFWANLYNAKTIDIVLDKYPVKSIKDISLGGSLTAFVTGGPWKAKVVTVSGVELSLDDIEHGILRPVFQDPRVHYAVNCASVGCPNLATQAFTGADLDAQLDAGARAYVNNSRGIKTNDGGVTASSIYKWFQVDFGGTAQGVLQHVKRYADDDLQAALKNVTTISGYAYDWSLNDAK